MNTPEEKLDIESEVSYWIFQANPQIWDLVKFLKSGEETIAWSVNQHKEEISKGDKVIIWQTGSSSGCYALGEIRSEIYKQEDKFGEFKADVKIDHNLGGNPITKKELMTNNVFDDFKAGNQGTNFHATKEQFETLLAMSKQPANKKAGSYFSELIKFINQAGTNELGADDYLKKYLNTKVRISFGRGNTAKVPWIAFLVEEQEVTKGIYPVYLYYKEQEILILAYGVSETKAPPRNWPGAESMHSIKRYFNERYGQDPWRYGDSFVYKVYETSDLQERNKHRLDGDLRILIEEYLSIDFGTRSDSDKSDSGLPSERPQEKSSRSFEITKLYFEDRKQLELKIIRAINNGKHLILIGAPGTGKSKLAVEICKFYKGTDNYSMSTATSDWSTYETIGGYKQTKEGQLKFSPGLFLKCFQNEKGEPINRWLIIDEINRADIDKAFGSLFSALAGDNITLPYEVEGNQVQIVGEYREIEETQRSTFLIPKTWRIIATLNSFDKASLYEMSYAFMRRFAFIPVSIPTSIDRKLILRYLAKWGLAENDFIDKIVSFWKLINKYRKIGPAIVKDIYQHIEGEDDFAAAFIMYVLPQFEGLDEEKQIEFVKSLCAELSDQGALEIKAFAAEYFDIDPRRFE
ncbi:MrcB family domain-containing protein [Candidatus Zixiibacteriota bacterium]